MSNNMPTARFVKEPLELFKGDYMIKLALNSSDAFELNKLTNKWHEEDGLGSKAKNEGGISNIKNFLKAIF